MQSLPPIASFNLRVTGPENTQLDALQFDAGGSQLISDNFSGDRFIGTGVATLTAYGKASATAATIRPRVRTRGDGAFTYEVYVDDVEVRELPGLEDF